MNLAQAFNPEFVVTVESLLGKSYPLKELLLVLNTLEKQLQALGYSTILNTANNAILVRRSK